MRALLLFLVLPLLTACPKRAPVDGAAPPADPLPIILATLGSGATVAELSGEFALEKGDFPGCVTGHSIASALHTAGEGLTGNLSGGYLPAVDFDISSCLAIPESGLPSEGEDVPALVEPVIEALLSGATTIIAAYKDQLGCEEAAWALAALEYASGISPAVIGEIDAPDGIVSFSEVPVDLESCEED